MGGVGFQALYRKYRPQNFAEVVGQKQVTQILRNSLKQGRVGHAYLFAGPRGTGKTSIARIYAKALNCPDLKDGDPCGVCEICTSIADGRAPDVIEIDAASNRGIDDVRDLRERVQYAPARFKYKTYIIDEAHMITGPAFNALLKTLEEPPAHIVFILCTTEAHKLPITILSRVMKFDFHLIPHQALADHVLEIARKENCDLAPDAAMLLAELSGGCVRDAISNLDQAMVYNEGRLTRQDVEELFYLTDPKRTVDLAVAVLLGDVDGVQQTGNDLVAAGRDPEHLLVELAEVLEKFLLSRSALRTALEERKLPFTNVPDSALVATISECWEASNRLRRESNPALLLRITLYRLVDLMGVSERSAKTQKPTAAAESLREGHPNLLPTARATKKEPEPVSKPAAADEPGDETEGLTVDDVEAEPPQDLQPEEDRAPRIGADGEPLGEDPGTSGLFGANKLQHAIKSNSERKRRVEPAPEPAPLPPPPASAAEQTPPPTGGPAPDSIAADERWRQVLEDVRKENLATFCLIFDGPEPTLSGATLRLAYPARLRYFTRLMRDAANVRVLTSAVRKHFGEKAAIEITGAQPDNKAADAAQRAVLDMFPGSNPANLGE